MKKHTPPRKTKRKPKPNGRPTKYNAQFHPMLAEYLARSGMIDLEIAEKLGISEVTLNAWKKKHPNFLKSLSNGKQRTNDGVKRALLSRALGFEYPHAVKMFFDKESGQVIEHQYTEYYPPDVRACEIWLYNRDKENWSNRHEITGEGGKPIVISFVGAFNGV